MFEASATPGMKFSMVTDGKIGMIGKASREKFFGASCQSKDIIQRNLVSAERHLLKIIVKVNEFVDNVTFCVTPQKLEIEQE
ncbi:hypothetical protein WA026_009035 [Henosepilachna vigintioctopunctata]|uniref:Uncharacterized protein n=1 Tax=Henosepilachna vigintioctopunctata TaxID=420089 RepID=A0AAW1UXS1_9CUCU